MTLEILTSDDLVPLRHGFFTRKGGASSGLFQGLNCGYGSSDQSDIVAINRARVADAMDVKPADLIAVYQHHSADVLTVDKPHDKPLTKADAVVTATPGLVLSILTADCQPVLFADHTKQVIGAAHAGWRGALDGVLENTIDAMISIGAVRENITAVIGPCISQAAYEVGPEFMDNIIADDMENSRFFAGGTGDRIQFDLPSYGLSRLRSAGIASASWNRHCTYLDEEHFYSYRRSVHRNEPDYGRLLSAIRL